MYEQVNVMRKEHAENIEKGYRVQIHERKKHHIMKFVIVCHYRPAHRKIIDCLSMTNRKKSTYAVGKPNHTYFSKIAIINSGIDNSIAMVFI